MALKKTGIQYINKDLDSFLRGIDRANDAVASFGRSLAGVGDHTRHGLGRADSALASLGRNAMATSNKVGAAGQIMIGAFREVGAMATRALADAGRAAGRLAFDFGKQALTGAMDLQDSMNLLGATSDATSDQMAQLRKQAIALGADLTLPATSAADAGAAMLELSKAGLTVDQVMKAAKGTLQLAAAANISEAQAAEIAANALNAFHLEGDRAVFVADLLAGAANKSSIEITDAAASFQMAAAVFSSLQGPAVGAEQAMIDMTTAIALLGNAGIKGSDAGTSLKQMLIMLSGPTDKAKKLMRELARSVGVSGDIAYTAAGKMRPLEEIIALVTKATAKMTEEQRGEVLKDIFGTDSIRAVLELMRAGPAEFDRMSAAITKQGSAAAMAAARTAGLRGAWDGLKSQIETAGIVLAEPFLEPLSLGLSALSDTIAEFPLEQWAKNAAGALGTLVRLVQGPMAPKEKRRMGGEADEEMVPAGEVSWRGLGNDALTSLLEYRDKIVGLIRENAPGIASAFRSWGEGASSWIKENAPTALGTLLEYRNQAVAFVMSNAPSVINAFGEWGKGMGNWITEHGPGMIRTFGEKTGELIDSIGKYAPGIVEALAKWGKEFIEWVPKAAPGLFKELLDLGEEVLDWVVERAPGIAKQLGDWAIAFIKWVPGATIDLIIAAGEMFGELLLWIVGKSPEIGKTLLEWATAFGNWVTNDAWPALLTGLGTLWTKLTTWISNKAIAIAADGSIGRAIVDGIWKGISGAWDWLVKKANALMNLLPKGMGDAIEAHSPSLVTARMLGAPMAQGIGVGFEHEIMRVQHTMALSMARLATPQAIMPSQRGDMFIPQQAQQIAQGMGGGQNVNVQINNPIVDSSERVSQLGAQIRQSVFAALNNGVIAFRAQGST